MSKKLYEHHPEHVSVVEQPSPFAASFAFTAFGPGDEEPSLHTVFLDAVDVQALHEELGKILGDLDA